MSRNKFGRILQNLNLCDNKQLDKSDKFLKFFPVSNELGKRFLKVLFQQVQQIHRMISC